MVKEEKKLLGYNIISDWADIKVLHTVGEDLGPDNPHPTFRKYKLSCCGRIHHASPSGLLQDKPHTSEFSHVCGG